MLDNAFDLFRRGVLAGLDAQAKVFDLLDELVEKGKIDESEREKFIQELDERLECSREKTEEFVNGIVNKITEKSPFAVRREVDKLRDQILTLESRIKKMEGEKNKKTAPESNKPESPETIVPIG